MKIRTTLIGPLLLAAGLTLAGCAQPSLVTGTAAVEAGAAGAAGAAATTQPAAIAAGAPSAPAVPSAAAKPEPTETVVAAAPVGTAEVGDLGTVLVGANGLTLYGFTKDADGLPTCYDACAAAWPAVLVDGDAMPAGLDPAVFSVVDRADGTTQLKAGPWPLYLYAGDGAAGEANGQGSGGVWFAVAVDGSLVKEPPAEPAVAPASPTPPAVEAAPSASSVPAAAAPASSAAAASGSSGAAAAPAGPVVSLADVANLGEVMVGANGHTLYAFTKDPAGQSTCVDACAAAWPPLLVEPAFVIPEELQAQGVTTFTRPDGSTQLVMGKWAMYSYSGDGAPGEANGQGSGGVWFTVNAACALVKTPLA